MLGLLPSTNYVELSRRWPSFLTEEIDAVCVHITLAIFIKLGALIFLFSQRAVECTALKIKAILKKKKKTRQKQKKRGPWLFPTCWSNRRWHSPGIRDFVQPILEDDSKLSFCSEWFISLGGINYYKFPAAPAHSLWKNMRVELCVSQRHWIAFEQHLRHCSSFMNLLFVVVFCLQILFFTVQYCNQPHDSTDISHAIHCCFPCLHIPGMSNLPAPEEASFLPGGYEKAKGTQ